MRAFFPEDEVNSVYDFPFESLTERGIRGIIFDIDNTLVPPDAPVDARCRALIRALKTAGFRICLVSNNKGPRIVPFATALNLPYVERALKPRRYGYRRAMARRDHSDRRPALHGYLGRQPRRHAQSPGKAHGAEGGDSNSLKAPLGAPLPLVLPEEKSERRGA